VKEKEKEREKQLRKNLNDLYAERGRGEKPKDMMKNIQTAIKALDELA